MYFIEHNTPFTHADHLIPLIKSLDPTSLAIQKMRIGQTKISCLIKNIIGEYANKEMIQKLRDSWFSIMADGSTDIGTTKNLILIARVVLTDQFGNEDIVDLVLALLKVINK